jgi:hypothetical protein
MTISDLPQTSVLLLLVPSVAMHVLGKEQPDALRLRREAIVDVLMRIAIGAMVIAFVQDGLWVLPVSLVLMAGASALQAVTYSSRRRRGDWRVQ